MHRFIILSLTAILPALLFAQLQNPRGVPYDWKTDTSKNVIELSEFQVVLPRKSFPIIDFPDFVSETEGRTMFFEHEPVIAVEIDGRAKAYPLNMLTMHEMTNDTLSGVPILPTYCPLCNASVTYDRRFSVDGRGEILEFEVSGMLRRSDMVMFDRQTETWWQQLMGEGLVGKYAGESLDVVPSLVISVDEFFTRYPDGQILSTSTGTSSEERYGKNPYVHYDSIGNNPYGRFFDAADVDDQLPAMERVIDIEMGGERKIYPWTSIANAGVIQDKFDGLDVVFFHQSGTVSVMDAAEISQSRDIGSVTVFSPVLDNGDVLSFHRKRGRIVDKDTGSEWDITGRCISGELEGTELAIIPYGSHFAFAMLAFYPEVEIFGQ